MQACKRAEIIEVIKVTIIEGSGNSEDDPIREIAQYWTKDGNLLIEEHPHNIL